MPDDRGVGHKFPQPRVSRQVPSGGLGRALGSVPGVVAEPPPRRPDSVRLLEQNAAGSAPTGRSPGADLPSERCDCRLLVRPKALSSRVPLPRTTPVRPGLARETTLDRCGALVR